MPSSTLSSLVSSLDPRSISEIAARFGQPKETVSHAMESSNACLLSGLAKKAGDSTSLGELFKLVSNAPASTNVSALASAVTDPSSASYATSSLLDSGKNLLSLAFGGNQSSILDALARSTGLRSGVASNFMTMAAPLLMSALGRIVRDDRMNPAGLSGLLANEAQGVRDLLPAGFSSLLSATPTPPTVTPSTRPVALGEIPEAPRRSRSLLWLIPVLLLIPLLAYWVNRARHAVVPTVPVVTLPNVSPSVPPKISLNIPQNTAAARLLDFIQDPTKGVDQGTWFDFNRFLFNSNSAALRPGYQDELGYVAAILKAFPNVNLEIGGYTDNRGNAQHNLSLSQARANTVKAALIAAGIAPDRLNAQGYGGQSPAADNATEQGRAANRRASIRVTQK